jgi:hypothetical protein
MEGNETEDYSFKPPNAERVAARALVLAAVSCRGLIEEHARDPGAEELRNDIVHWLRHVGAAAELEAAEADLLAIPVGRLDRKATVNATWRSEGMVVLAWALQRVALPSVHTEPEPSEVANAIGFLHDRQTTVLARPHLRDLAEIEHRTNTYLTLHWRLRQFSIEPAPMDFRAYIARCTWANLTPDGLELIGDDLAINGTPIDKVDERARRHAVSIAIERHQAFNWLLGFESEYSAVTTDT